MKKIILSLTLLASTPLIISTPNAQPPAESAPEPAVQDQAVIEAVDYAETHQNQGATREVLPQIVALDKDLEMHNISEPNRNLIAAALVRLAQNGKLKKHEFIYEAALIITQIVKHQFEFRAFVRFNDPMLANRLGNSEGRNALTDIKNKGLRGRVIAPYFDQKAEERFMRETSKPAYDEYRRW